MIYIDYLLWRESVFLQTVKNENNQEISYIVFSIFSEMFVLCGPTWRLFLRSEAGPENDLQKYEAQPLGFILL
jgi:hypothetical protein